MKATQDSSGQAQIFHDFMTNAEFSRDISPVTLSLKESRPRINVDIFRHENKAGSTPLFGTHAIAKDQSDCMGGGVA